MSRRELLWLMVLALAIPGCTDTPSWQEEVRPKREPSTPWREKYLLDGIGHLRMDDISKTLGPPVDNRKLGDGSTEATYQYTSFSVPGTVAEDVGESSCTDYVVKFGSDGVLRQMRRKKC